MLFRSRHLVKILNNCVPKVLLVLVVHLHLLLDCAFWSQSSITHTSFFLIDNLVTRVNMTLVIHLLNDSTHQSIWLCHCICVLSHYQL